MRSSAQEKLLNLLYRALKPLVHLLLESGIGHREFSEIAKKAFVDVATKNYGIRGRATNISRVAVMTGLTRKEVKKIRDHLSHPSNPAETKIRPIPASVVLTAWHDDPDFRDAAGRPKLLPFSDAANSFNDLVKKYAGDIPPGAIRAELKRTGAVLAHPNGDLEAKRRTYVPFGQEELIERALSRPLLGLLLTIRHNSIAEMKSSDLSKLKDFEPSDTWPERMVSVSEVPQSRAAEARELVRRRLVTLTEDMDRDLGHLARHTDEKNEKSVDIGMGAYYFET